MAFNYEDFKPYIDDTAQACREANVPESKITNVLDTYKKQPDLIPHLLTKLRLDTVSGVVQKKEIGLDCPLPVLLHEVQDGQTRCL